MTSRQKALFLDRDGIINIDHGYVFKPEHFDFVDGIFELCKTAIENDYIIIIITNQAGIGRGYYTEEDFSKITDWMKNKFSEKNILISDVYYCPYHPEYGIGDYKRESSCRKPAPGMILQAADDHDIDLTGSILVGDKVTDMLAGVNAGIKRNILFPRDDTEKAKSFEECVLVNDLSDVIKLFKKS